MVQLPMDGMKTRILEKRKGAAPQIEKGWNQPGKNVLSDPRFYNPALSSFLFILTFSPVPSIF